MRRLLLITSLVFQFCMVNAQISFDDFTITVDGQAYSAGETISLEDGEMKTFNYNVQLSKPKAFSVGDGYYEIVVASPSDNVNSLSSNYFGSSAWSDLDPSYFQYSGSFTFQPINGEHVAFYARLDLNSEYYSSPIELDINSGASSPLVADAGPDKSILSGDNAVIGGSPSASGGAGDYDYSWSPSSSLNSSTQSNPTASPTSTTTYTLTVTDDNGVQDTDEVTVTVSETEPLIAKASSSPYIHIGCGQEIQLGGMPSASGGIPPYSYEWSPSAGLNSNNSANPLASPSESTIYTLTVTDSEGNIDSDQVDVTILRYEWPPRIEAPYSQPRKMCPGESDDFYFRFDNNTRLPTAEYFEWESSIGIVQDWIVSGRGGPHQIGIIVTLTSEDTENVSEIEIACTAYFECNGTSSQTTNETYSLLPSDCGEFDVEWTDMFRTSLTTPTRIKNTNTSSGWKSSAASTNRIPSNTDGYLAFTVPSPKRSRMIGFSRNNYNDGTWQNHWETIENNLYLTSSGSLNIYQSASYIGSAGTYNEGDDIKIERTSDGIKFYVNNQLRYTLSSNYGYSFIADFCLHTPNDYFENVVMSVPSSGSSSGGRLDSESNIDHILTKSDPILRDSLIADKITYRPNPTTNKIIITLNFAFSTKGKLKIYSEETGRLLSSDEIHFNEYGSSVINISYLASGHYIFELQIDNKLKSFRVLKE